MYTVEQKVAKMQGLDKLSLWTKINNRFEKFFLVDIFGWSKIFEKCKKACRADYFRMEILNSCKVSQQYKNLDCLINEPEDDAHPCNQIKSCHEIMKEEKRIYV